MVPDITVFSLEVAGAIKFIPVSSNLFGPTTDPIQAIKTRIKLHRIERKACIGCTLCIQACPVDAIVGASKQMHTVLPEWCTGCDLCVAPCPVDCIHMLNVTGDQTGWNAWSPAQADLARARYESHLNRFEREERDQEERLATKAKAKLAALDQSQATSQAQREEIERKRAIIAAAIARVKQSGS
ncbi:MAG: RnfABCDGE type electron transport complex subunit B [Burkholderiaceae bacterium]|nr:RnfABCDGE type electron transport complex subunit B [Burkholderiaceae bacterium]